MADTGPSADTAAPTRRVAPLVVGAVAVVLVAFVAVLFAALGGDDGGTADTPLIGRAAPTAVGELADGTTFDLSRRRGSWVVLNFFTHNCVPCIREHPELIDFVDRQRAAGLDGAEFYTIVQGSTREQVDAFFAEYGGDWPVVYDPDLDFQLGFGVVQVPETWIIDPDGVVQLRTIFEVDADSLSNALQVLREQFGRAR